jgi:alpha-tubulin suppressor-like RCC1 family protein
MLPPLPLRSKPGTVLLWVALVCTSAHASAPPGLVIGWGDNGAGEATAVPTWVSPNVPSSSTNAVRVAGQLLTNVTAVAAGHGHSLALRADGTIVGWGGDLTGEVTGSKSGSAPDTASGTVTIGGQALSDVISIAAGYNYSLALTREGRVVAWGTGPTSDRENDLTPQPV